MAISTDLQLDPEGNWLKLKEEGACLYLKSFKGDREYLLKRGYGEALLAALKSSDKTDEYISILSNDGYSHITCIYLEEDLCLLKSDIVRAYPIYYKLEGSDFTVKDRLPITDKFKTDEESITEFIATGYISGSRTIYSDIQAIQAAEIILVKNEIRRHRYFYNKTDDIPREINLSIIESEAHRLDKLFSSVFEELIDSVPPGGRIVVPLSGGHDSRLVVNYLYKLGYKNVLCYTYGTTGNIQSEISRQVAEALGYEWHFVEYTEEKWKMLHDSGDIEKYFDFAFRGVSTPHLQDFLAVHELKNKEVLRPNDAVVPGHGLDILCHIIDTEQYSKDVVEASVRRLVWKKISYNDKKSIVYQRYKGLRDRFPFEDKYFTDHLFWQERQCKFIINSLRVYEYFGLQARIPFWDFRIVKYWLSVPMKLKFNRGLLFEMEEKVLLTQKLKQIPFNKGRIVNEKEKAGGIRLKNLKKMIPASLKIMLLRMTKKKQQQPEGLNLIYSLKINEVSDLVGKPDLWPKEAKRYFKKDLKRLPFQINHDMLIRLHTVNMLKNN